MHSRRSVADEGSVTPSPLTERVLVRLGRPKGLWILLWACAALVSPLVVVGAAIVVAGERFDPAELVNLFATQAVLAYACFVLLWGSALLARQAALVQEEVARLVSADAPAHLFRAIGSTRAPLALTAIVVAVATANGWARYGPVPPLAALPVLFLYTLPILTFVWVYLTILADLDRLGREPLALDRFPQDRTLGLEQVGSLASTGLGLVLAAAVPVLLAASDEPVTFAISLTVVAMTVAVFVLSMWRLHRQMADAKRRYVALARRVYAEAYAPLREQASLEALTTQASALGAAQSLDERAHSLPTWPIDEGTLRFIAVIVTGVLTSLVVRALFAAVGF